MKTKIVVKLDGSEKCNRVGYYIFDSLSHSFCFSIDGSEPQEKSWRALIKGEVIEKPYVGREFSFRVEQAGKVVEIKTGMVISVSTVG